MHFISHLLCADDMNSTLNWNEYVNLVPNALQTSIEAKYSNGTRCIYYKATYDIISIFSK